MPTYNPFPIAFSQRVIKPEQFGTPTGTDPNVDMPLLESAISAVSDGNGGTILLTGTYAYDIRYTRDVGPNRDINYGININGNNITVTGGGTLKLASEPALTSPIGVLIGNGLYDLDIDGGPATGDVGETQIDAFADAHDPHTDGLGWIDGFVMRDIHFDNSVLDTNTKLQNANNGVINSVLFLSGCRGAVVSDITFDRGYGGTGVIGCHAHSKNLYFHDITINLAYAVGGWFDGVYDSTFERITVLDAISTTAAGLVLAANTDYRRVSRRSIVKNCEVHDVHTGIAISGGGTDQSKISDGNTVENNTIWLTSASTTHFGIQIGGAVTVRGVWGAYGNQILNNTINRPSDSTTGGGYAVVMGGSNGTYNGQPASAKAGYNEIHGNIIGDSNRKMTYQVIFQFNSEYNNYTNNTGYCTIKPSADQSGGTEVGNVSSPNSVL